jgi:hypothetical protein
MVVIGGRTTDNGFHGLHCRLAWILVNDSAHGLNASYANGFVAKHALV